jgi:hypothetical protein
VYVGTCICRYDDVCTNIPYVRIRLNVYISVCVIVGMNIYAYVSVTCEFVYLLFFSLLSGSAYVRYTNVYNVRMCLCV